MRRLRRRPGREDGATIVEFALALPLFAILLFGLVDSGLAFGGFLTLRNGVDAGARMAAVDQVAPSCASSSSPMTCTVCDRIGSFVSLSTGSVQVAVSFPSPSGPNATNADPVQGDEVEVSATATIRSATGLVPFLNGRTVHATSTVRLEQNPDRYTPNVYSEGPTTC